MRAQIQTILEQTAAGLPSAYTFEAEGETYIREFRPRSRLIVLGCGHISQPVCRYAADLGFSVFAADDRPAFANEGRFPEATAVLCDAFPAAIARLKVTEEDYVALVTRGHRYDAECLRALLSGTFPRYLGMIGSKRRVASLFNLLEEEGYARELLERIHAPIGLPIGALTIEEIAISIVAELIACRRQGTDRRAHGTLLVTQDIDSGLMAFLREETPKALLTVFHTQGSTPVKSGAMMAVDKNLRTAGSVGGGCTEDAALREAFRLIGSGESRCIEVDLSEDVAEEEGMVCGGQMRIFLEDLG